MKNCRNPDLIFVLFPGEGTVYDYNLLEVVTDVADKLTVTRG